MNKYLVSLMAVGAMALTVAAGDLRQVITVPVLTLAVTNSVFQGQPVRSQATAHPVIISASATTNAGVTLVLNGTGYTNTFGIASLAGNGNFQTNAVAAAAQQTVGANDQIVITLTATNTVPAYFYISYQGY